MLIEVIEGVNSKLDCTSDNLLVRGEGRYHGHFIEGDVDIYPNPDFGIDDTISHFLELKGLGVLKHLHTETKMPTGEHQNIELKPGAYRVIRQREYNPYARIIQIVRD